MNNHRLLAGLLVVALLSAGVRAVGGERQIHTIEELFDVAEANSAQLRPALTAREEARRGIAEARSKRLPDINASLSLSYLGDGFTTQRNFSDYQKAPIPHLGTGVSLGIVQPVYAGGAITAGIDLAELNSTAQGYATEMQRDNIRFRIAATYLDIYKYRNLRGVMESNIGSARKMLAEMQARFEQGVALHNDITRYELLLSDLELQLLRIDNTLSILNSDLVVTAGLPAGTEILPDTTLLARALPCDGEGWWQLQATENAPAMGLARTGVDISRKSEAIVRSERLPRISLLGGWSLDGPILVEVPPINRNLSYWYVGVGVSYNLSSLFKTNKSLARSRMAVSKAQEQLTAAGENLSLDIRADYIRYTEAYEELKTRTKGVELAERNYRTVATRYSAGMALITDMLDAADTRLDAERQLVNARIGIIYCYYKLLFTSGKI